MIQFLRMPVFVKQCFLLVSPYKHGMRGWLEYDMTFYFLVKSVSSFVVTQSLCFNRTHIVGDRVEADEFPGDKVPTFFLETCMFDLSLGNLSSSSSREKGQTFSDTCYKLVIASYSKTKIFLNPFSVHAMNGKGLNMF